MSYPEPLGRPCSHPDEELVALSRMVGGEVEGSGQNLDILRDLSCETNRSWRWSGHREGGTRRTVRFLV